MSDLASIHESIKKLQENIGSVFIGKEEAIKTTLVAFFSDTMFRILFDAFN